MLICFLAFALSLINADVTDFRVVLTGNIDGHVVPTHSNNVLCTLSEADSDADCLGGLPRINEYVSQLDRSGDHGGCRQLALPRMCRESNGQPNECDA